MVKYICNKDKKGGEDMKILKTAILFLFVITLSFILTGCTSKQKNIEGSLEDIMKEVYKSIPEDKTPKMLANTPVTKENVKNFLGTEDINYKEALASESMTGSIAHSVVLVRVENISEIEDTKKKIKDNINPRKWICVGVEKVVVESYGDLIIVILDDNNGDTILNDFKALQK